MPRTVFAVTGKVNFCWFCSVSTPFRARHCMQGMGHVKTGLFARSANHMRREMRKEGNVVEWLPAVTYVFGAV